MNLERLPEIVDAVKPVADAAILKKHPFNRDEYTWIGMLSFTPCRSTDAANACVVAMLGRLAANGHPTTVGLNGIDTYYASEYHCFSGDLLNALYDAFRLHPEWFAALDADERGGKDGK